MRRTRVKICGLTRAEDAAMAAACGADAVGLLMHPASPRNVSIATAKRIMEALPPFVTPVGLFVDASAEHILGVSAELGLRCVQLHGHESPEVVAALGGLFVIKAVRAEAGTLTQSLQQFRGLANLGGIVLETAGTREPGGTGIVNDWDLIRGRVEAGDFQRLPPMIVAGGLKPSNVGAVIRLLRPWAVDVSSGVEVKRGEKSEARVREFMEAVREADDSN
jgi:phosphoribosylanthranilate isomerase